MEARAPEIKKKKTTGRRKIPIEKIGNKTKLQVCFSKRRRGLFKMTGDMAVQCGAKVAVIVISPSGKPQSFGSSSVQEMVDSYLHHQPPASPPPTSVMPAEVGGGSAKEPPVVVADESFDMLSVFRDEPAVGVEPRQLGDWSGGGVLASGGGGRACTIWNSQLLDVVDGLAAGYNFSSSVASSSPQPASEKERVWTVIDEHWPEEGGAAGRALPMDFLPRNS